MHRRLFDTQSSSLTRSGQVPIGAANIFKSSIYPNKPNVSDYLTCESTDEDPVGKSSAERPLQFSNISNDQFHRPTQWPSGGLAYSISELTNNRIDMEALKEESKAILLDYMDPQRALHGLDSAVIPSK